MESHLMNIGWSLDNLATVEIRERRPDQGIVRILYEAALDRHGAPLTMLAAQRLADSVSSGDIVLIATGAGQNPEVPKGETDGPIGSVALARFLRYAIDALPVILCEQEFYKAMIACCGAAGISVRSLDDLGRVPFTVAVECFPGDDSANDRAEELIDTLGPKAVIAVEKIGPNHRGVAHNSTGYPADPNRSRIEHVFEEARSREILTIGIGDYGNEIGFGRIADVVAAHKEHGAQCRCPCDGGVACVVEADVLIVAGISNWGAYGLEAALAAVFERPDLIHDATSEQRALSAYVEQGGEDGSTGQQTLTVDATPLGVQTSMLELMRAVVEKGIQPQVWKRPW